MPALPARQLVDAVLDAVWQSGGTAVFVSALRKQPKRFIIAAGSDPEELLVYIWTLTFGGRRSLPDEYRVQLTGVRPPLIYPRDGRAVLLGYEPDLRIFAGFDLARHSSFTPGSPSIQIRRAALCDAVQNGFGFHRKENGELAVAFRPECFLAYVRCAQDLHKASARKRFCDLLCRASARASLPDEALTTLPRSQRRVVETVTRLSRSSTFREQVINAYSHRCAVTRMQLGLVEAAHILPVAAPESYDDVRNGIALAPTYHRAFDAGLIYLDLADGRYVMRLNERKRERLAQLRIDGGMETFKSPLGPIHLPHDVRQHPDPATIRKANRFRGVA